MLNSCKGLLRNSHTRIEHFVRIIHLSTLLLALDDALENLEPNIVRVAGLRDINIIEEQVLHLLTFMDDNSHVTPIINN